MIQVVETWKPIPKWEGVYEVSDQGRVRSLDRIVTYKDGRRRLSHGRVITPMMRGHSQSYLYVALWCGQKRVTMYVHRAVLLAFVGPPPDGDAQASHEPNPDSFDCRLVNLRWRTPEYNNTEKVYRQAGMTPEEAQAILARACGFHYDPVLTGETPF
jgi:hypothetical protein